MVSKSSKQSNKSSTKSSKSKKAKKKNLIGPKNNQVDFYRILWAEENNDDEVLGLTTLMIKNIPIKITQNDMLQLLDKNFAGRYNYFYLPMDLKTQCSVGFAFINFVSHVYILDFFLEFQCLKWSETLPNCNSNKHVDIVYANMQGIDEIKKELLNKNIMKKNDSTIKPIINDHMEPDEKIIKEIKERYFYNERFIHYYQQRLIHFSQVKAKLQAIKQQNQL